MGEGVQIPQRRSSCWQNQQFQLIVHMWLWLYYVYSLYMIWTHRMSALKAELLWLTVCYFSFSHHFRIWKLQIQIIQGATSTLLYSTPIQNLHHKELSILPYDKTQSQSRLSNTHQHLTSPFLNSTEVCLILPHPTAYDQNFTSEWTLKLDRKSPLEFPVQGTICAGNLSRVTLWLCVVEWSRWTPVLVEGKGMGFLSLGLEQVWLFWGLEYKVGRETIKQVKGWLDRGFGVGSQGGSGTVVFELAGQHSTV